MPTSCSTRSSTRASRAALVASAAFFAALLVIPSAALAGHGGSAHGGSGHGGSGHGSSGHGGGATHGNGGSHGGGCHSGGAGHGGGFRHVGCGWSSWGWGWGWAPYYSTWWLGGPGVYVVADDGDEYGSEDNEAAPPPSPRRAQRRYDEWSDRDEALSESEERVDLRAESLPRPAGNRARMRFKVTPEDAAVYVDDKYLGSGEDLAASPRGVVADPGTHSIAVVRPGYKTKTVDITVSGGAPVDVVVELEK